jgi:hypothetical protein
VTTKRKKIGTWKTPNLLKIGQKVEKLNLSTLLQDTGKNSTVKPVYNGHPWDLEKRPFDRGV